MTQTKWSTRVTRIRVRTTFDRVAEMLVVGEFTDRQLGSLAQSALPDMDEEVAVVQVLQEHDIVGPPTVVPVGMVSLMNVP